MKRHGKTLFAAALLAALIGRAAVRAQGDALAGLAWMEGTWTGEDAGTVSEETWTSPRGGMMLGVHRDVAGGKTVSYEFLRIQATPDSIVYFASPKGAPPTPFRLVEKGPARAVFENRKHDFPVRILYWLDAGGALHARIEGPGEKPKAFEWVWRKAPPPRN
ncbi:MAG: DUF6265 family protein [Thermoanaerobaculia bacterium]